MPKKAPKEKKTIKCHKKVKKKTQKQNNVVSLSRNGTYPPFVSKNFIP